MGGPTSSSGQIAAMTGEWDAMKSGVMSLATTGTSPALQVATGTPAYGVTPLSASSSMPPPAPARLSEAPRPRSNSTLWVGVAALFAIAAIGGYILFGREQPPPTSAPIASTVTPPPTTGTIAPPSTTVGSEATAPPETTTAPTHAVLVSLRSQPSGATVAMGDRTFGPTPTQVELTGDQAADGESLHFVFSRPGFRDMPMDITVAGATLDVNARMVRSTRTTSAHPESTGGEASGDTHVEGYRDSPY